MNAQEANGEQREKNGGKFAETDDFGRAVLKRKPPETAPTLGERAKKIPTEKGWDFTFWWRTVDHVPTGLPSLWALARGAAGLGETCSRHSVTATSPPNRYPIAR